jgi:hypothetical protein
MLKLKKQRVIKNNSFKFISNQLKNLDKNDS